MKLGNGAYITRALSRIIFSFYYWSREGSQSGNFLALNYDNSGQRQISQPQIKTRRKRGMNVFLIGATHVLRKTRTLNEHWVGCVVGFHY